MPRAKPAVTAAAKHGSDPYRFYCPYPGCKRSFAELWRLKVSVMSANDTAFVNGIEVARRLQAK